MDQAGSHSQLASPLRTGGTRDDSYEDTSDDCSSLGRKDRFRGVDSSGGPPASSKWLSEHTQPRVLNEGEVDTFSCVCQLHLSHHSCVWDGIARVNEEIILTMLDIFEKHGSK